MLLPNRVIREATHHNPKEARVRLAEGVSSQALESERRPPTTWNGSQSGDAAQRGLNFLIIVQNF